MDTTPRKKSSAVKWIVAAVLIVALLAVMWATNPDRTQHVQALSQHLAGTAAAQALPQPADSLSNQAVVCWDFSDQLGEEASLQQALDASLSLTDWHVCSVGSLPMGGKPVRVSVGIFGHVFCCDLKQ